MRPEMRLFLDGQSAPSILPAQHQGRSMVDPARFALLIVAAAALSAGGCVTRSIHDEPVREVIDDHPCIAVWYNEGFRILDDEECGGSGLEMAVWTDGTLLLSPIRSCPGKHMLVGKVQKEDLPAVLRAIREAGFWQDWDEMLVIDAGFTTIVVWEDGKEMQHVWYGSLMPGFGGDINTDPAYRSFVRMWKRVEGAIETLAPVELHRASEQLRPGEDFRGYVFDAPWKTAWFR